jgi:hypothetical protein
MAILPAVLLAQAIEQIHRTVARKLVALGLRELTSAADPEIISSIIAVLAIEKCQFALGRFEGRGSAHLRLLFRYRVSRRICPGTFSIVSTSILKKAWNSALKLSIG